MASTARIGREGGAPLGGERTPAQWYCLLAGAALLLAGALGFIADASWDTGTEIEGSNFIVFEVNGWHNVVHLLSGVLLLAAAARRTSARTIALLFGLTYAAVAIWGLLADVVLGLLPINAADNVLHLAIAGLGIAAGLASSPERASGRATPATSVR